jgi:hypothetical protein
MAELDAEESHDNTKEPPNRKRITSDTSRNSSTCSNRSMSHYLPEKIKIYNKQLTTCQSILS